MKQQYILCFVFVVSCYLYNILFPSKKGSLMSLNWLLGLTFIFSAKKISFIQMSFI